MYDLHRVEHDECMGCALRVIDAWSMFGGCLVCRWWMRNGCVGVLHDPLLVGACRTIVALVGAYMAGS